ncbi:DUF4355 domain-containing protein [Micrococcus luteus]|nr:DUF4355 domain-containing protein [Micrococcus luteus]
MSNVTTESIDNTADAGDNTEVSTYKAPATQEELDNIIQKRLAKERAKYADYDELKSAAEKFQEIEDAKKSELEKATERAAQLEAELAEAKHAALKNGLAAEFGLSAEDTSLFLTAGDEEGLRKQAEALVSRISKASEPEAPVMGNVIPDLVQRKTESSSSKDDFARTFFGI